MGNKNTVRNLAIGMIVVALGLGLYTLRLGSQLGRDDEAAAAAAPELPRIAIAVEAIEAGRPIRAEAVSLEPVGVVPEGAFLSADEVVGRELEYSLSVGEPILPKHFRSPGPIVGRLEENERAMAVKVDGVIGLGGFIQPGDRVDVLLYLARDTHEVKKTQARVLLEDVRVLAYGENIDGGERDGDRGPSTAARTAVLAVQRDQVPQLMLGASKGRLRLALLGGGEQGPVAKKGDVVTLAGLQGVKAKARPKAPAKRGPRVYRGREKEMTRY